ncbi:MAG: sigma-54-dependent transcriptional regulator [Gammaproteobacteria bacterium]
MSRVLIIDDNEGVCSALGMLLDVNGIETITANDTDTGLKLLAKGNVDLVIQDMNFTADTTSGEEGVELYYRLRKIDPDLPIILLTAWTHLETAVELVREGASDYLAKPWDDTKLMTTVRNLLELREATQLAKENDVERRMSQDKLAESYDLCGLVYASRSMHELVSVATRIARSEVPVLITGANGAGKERLAHIVQANSAVSDGPFITVNAGALPQDLIESELFGAEAGAYTGAGKERTGRFEAADGGTLFLDEIGNLPLEGQAKLLRVLQSGEFERLGSSKTRTVTVRIISATNSDLSAAVARGEFREDLLYRLNLIELCVPPLVERPADILPLAQHFLGDNLTLSNAAEQALRSYSWPGNVRELQNCLKRAALLTADSVIDVADLALKQDLTPPVAVEVDEETIHLALGRNGGVVARAARELGISRQALYRRMEKFGIAK